MAPVLYRVPDHVRQFFEIGTNQYQNAHDPHGFAPFHCRCLLIRRYALRSVQQADTKHPVAQNSEMARRMSFDFRPRGGKTLERLLATGEKQTNKDNSSTGVLAMDNKVPIVLIFSQYYPRLPVGQCQHLRVSRSFRNLTDANYVVALCAKPSHPCRIDVLIGK